MTVTTQCNQWEGGFRVPMIVRWPNNVPASVINNEIVSALDFLPTLVAAAGEPQDLVNKLLDGYEGYKVHLDGYNQLDLFTGVGPSKGHEIIYYEGTTLQAVRYNDWKAHFIVQNEGWFGPAKRIVQQHLARFVDYPSRQSSAHSNAEEIKEQVRGDAVGQ